MECIERMDEFTRLSMDLEISSTPRSISASVCFNLQYQKRGISEYANVIRIGRFLRREGEREEGGR